MKLDFTTALNKPESEFDFAFEWECDSGLFESVPHKPNGNGLVETKYKSSQDGEVTLKLSIRVPFTFVCDKCASEFEKNLFLEHTEQIKPDWVDDYDGITYDSNGEMDIDYLVHQVVLSSFPSLVLCSPNCKGLCLTCGVNKNFDTCNCDKNKIGKNNPFADLLGLNK